MSVRGIFSTSSPSALSPHPESLSVFFAKLLIILAVAVGTYIVYLLFSIITTLILAGFLALLLLPVVQWLRKYHVREVFAIILLYVFGIFIVFILAIMIVPVIITEVQLLITTISNGFVAFQDAYKAGGVANLGLPTWMLPTVSTILDAVHAGTLLGVIRGHASDISGFIIGRTGSIVSDSVSFAVNIGNSLFSAVIILVLTFFMLMERSGIYAFIHAILPEGTSRYLSSREQTVVSALSAWFRGQMILSISIAFTTYIGLSLLALLGFGIPERGTFALIAGCFEFVPVLGPILAFVPAFGAALAISWQTSLAIIILYVAIQQIEGNILVPAIMSRSLALSALTVFIAMLVGALLGGVLGVILAVPVTAVITIFVRDVITWKKKKGVKIPS